MRLTSITVTKFRNIVESQRVEIEDDVTCLVGKNEGGKTTILQALYRLNPANDGSTLFDVTTEYPRWRLIRDRKSDDLNAVRPISAEFALDESDRDALEEHYGQRPPASSIVYAGRTYANERRIYLRVPVAELIEAALLDASVDDQDAVTVKGSASLDAAAAAAKSAAKELKADGQDLRGKAMTAFAAAVVKYKVFRGVDVPQEATNELWGRLPKFFYFSNYDTLPGETNLNDLAQKVEEGEDLSSPERTVMALLAHAGETPADFLDDEYVSRKAELQAASSDLSRRVFEYWRQNPDLAVVFDTDNVVIRSDRLGNEVANRFLKIELRDGRHGDVETNFNTRSTGFQWFFSFFAAFSEYQDSDESIIVLLDEPGTSLHGDAQRDFVRFIFEELGASKQTLYTTHSQHMVDPTKYEKLRAVHDRATREDPDQGVVVTPISLSADAATLLPVESALGYSVSQHLFIGSGQHLLVEGSSDFVFLQRMTEYLLLHPQDDAKGLDPRLAILPVGGIDNMPAFVALLGRRLSVSALIDGDRTNAKLQRVKKAADHNGVDEGVIVVCSDIDKMPTNADIEDLFDVADYVRLYNWAFDDNLKASELANTDEPIIKKIASMRGSFDHALPAHALTLHRDEFFAGVKARTVKQFAALMEKLNATVTI